MARSTLRVACCQFAPVLRNVQASISKAEDLMINLNPGDADLIVLPELAFTGYMFRDKETVRPFAEHGHTGPTVKWAKSTAKRLNAHVVVGYPRVEPATATTSEHLYNSLVLIGPDSAVLATYDKHFLYEIDEGWAEEGKGFMALEVDKLGKIGLGICMDVNPRRFEAPLDNYEWATFLAKEKVDIAVLIAAWLDHNVDSEETLYTPNYWANRMTPLFYKPATLVVCNRTGTEDGVTFGGCSCVVSLREPMLLAHLNKRQENILLVDLERPGRPKAERCE